MLLPYSTTPLRKVDSDKIQKLYPSFRFLLSSAADISISGDVGNKWTNLKSLCFELRDSAGLSIPLDTKSHLVVKVYNM